MLPNRIVAAALVALLAMQIVPAPAHAQLGTADLIIESVDVGTLRVATVNAPVNVTVRNIGSGDFIPPSAGWQIFVGLGGTTNNHCIERGEGASLTEPRPGTSPCYIVILAGQANATIGAGQARTYQIAGGWTAERSQANTSALLYAEIMTFGQTNPGSSCNGPEPDNPTGNGVNPDCNNAYRRNVFVGNPGVRAEPDRTPSPSASGGDKNVAWKLDEIRSLNQQCPAAPARTMVGCTIPAGRSLSAYYNITNVGTVPDSYSPSLAPADWVERLRNRGYTFDFAPHSFSLGPGERREVRLTIYVPENETALVRHNIGLANLTASWRSSVAPGVTTADDEAPGCTPTHFYCEDPILPSFEVGHRRAFNVTANFTHDDVGVGETSEFLLNITNEGNADDTFNVSFVRTGNVYAGTINDSWSPRVGADGTRPWADVDIPKGQTRTVRVFVTPSQAANSGILNTTYHFAVQVRSTQDTDGTAPCKRFEILALQMGEGVCTVNLQVHMRQTWGIAGFNDAAHRVVPGETREYTLGVRNTGNGYDNITLELQTTVFGWDVRLSNTSLRLTPGNTSLFTLTVTSPPNTPENTVGAFYVNATSSGPPETPLQLRSNTSIMSMMTIIRGPNIRLEAPVNTSFVDPGATVEYQVVVTNTGNVADNFTILPPDRPSDWGVTFSPTDLELQPNQQGTITIGMRAPSSAEVGEKATAIAKVRSTVERTREKTINLEARVSGPDLFVDNVLVNSTNPYTGDPLEVSVVVGNAGNKPHDRNMTLRVYFVQNGVERVIGERHYPSLFIGAQRRLTETFAWDTSGVEGSGVILARIDVDNNVKEIDDSAASNERTRSITLRTFQIAITPAQGQSARPGERLTYGDEPNVFIVTYNGNQPTEPVTIRFESEHGWLTSQSELSLALPRGTPIPIIATLEVPTLPGTARDTLTMSVVPALRPEEVRRASAVTTILDEEKPIVKRITATPQNGKLGDTVVIEVEVEDATGASFATAYVTFPTNETSAVQLTKVGPNLFRGDRTFGVAGAYRIAAEVVDAADPPNKNDTRLAMGSFALTPGSVPTIKLAAGQSTTIRTGSPIKLDIADPLGIGRASYSIRGVSYELRGPAYQIDTSTLTSGTVDVNVTAENIYGVSSSQRFTFVVDNAAPGITRVVINPERPRANEDVTISVVTEAKVDAVDVLVKRDGQVVQTLNATKRGVGNFVVTFNPPQGDYRLDVTARDAAGNTKLAEGAVVFSAKPGSPFEVPGPAPWLVLAALALLALALRRRS